jgi:hypothetical protein
MHIATIPPMLNFVAVSTVCALAVWRGGPRERLIATLHQTLLLNGATYIDPTTGHPILMPASSAQFALTTGHAHVLESIGHPHFLPTTASDAVEFLACLACIVSGGGYWTIWAAAALLLSLATDALMLAQPDIGAWAYVSAEWVWFYIATIALLWGALTRGRRGPAPAPPGALPSLGFAAPVRS